MAKQHIGCIGTDCPICVKIRQPGYEKVRLNLKVWEQPVKQANVVPPKRPQSSAAIPSRSKTPCKHLGQPTDARVVCPSCTGHVELKVFNCEIHSSCVLEKQVPDMTCCKYCKDRE